jgi:hypothetical protein
MQALAAVFAPKVGGEGLLEGSAEDKIGSCVFFLPSF